MTIQLMCLADIALSVLLGFLIGLERKLRSKDAGIRTHTIVCMGSALMMVVSQYAFISFADYDPARIAAQIVSGIGFLGAGMIVYNKHEIRGLTTAAGMWATAGVGMACGARMYILAAGATLLLILAQCILHANWKLFKVKKTYRLSVAFVMNDDEAAKVKEIFGVKHFQRFKTERQGDSMICEVTIVNDFNTRSEKLAQIMRENPFIKSIQRVDEE